MKKSKSIQFVINDFQDIYDMAKSISLYEYVNSSLFKDEKLELNPEAVKIFNHLKIFESGNNLYNYFTVNIISIMENYLQNILIEIIEKDDEKSMKFIKEYRFEKNLTPQDVIDGPRILTVNILNNIIYHNLPKVNSLYKIIYDLDILNIKDVDIKMIFQIIKLRHNIVHKSSRFNEKKVTVKLDSFLGFLNLISNWLLNIDSLIMTNDLRKRTTDYKLKFYTEIYNSMENPILEVGKFEVISNSVAEIFDKEFDNNKILI